MMQDCIEANNWLKMGKNQCAKIEFIFPEKIAVTIRKTVTIKMKNFHKFYSTKQLYCIFLFNPNMPKNNQNQNFLITNAELVKDRITCPSPEIYYKFDNFLSQSGDTLIAG